MPTNKRITWLTIVLLLFFISYIYDNASVGEEKTKINEIWKSLHGSNQWFSLGFMVVFILILLYHLIIAFIPEPKPPIPPKQEKSIWEM
jgi:uncharacterized membrane protein YukC